MIFSLNTDATSNECDTLISRIIAVFKTAIKLTLFTNYLKKIQTEEHVVCSLSAKARLGSFSKSIKVALGVDK